MKNLNIQILTTEKNDRLSHATSSRFEDNVLIGAGLGISSSVIAFRTLHPILDHTIIMDRDHKLWLQGTSIAVRALRESIEAHAGSDDAVLLTGPNGAGQEAVARAIHRSSPRAGRPFIYVACPHVSAADDTAFGFRSDSSDQPSAGKMALRRAGGAMPNIGLKRVYDPPETSDGYRILVERLWPRGLTKEKARVDLWLKEISPSQELRRWYGHDQEKWPEFRHAVLRAHLKMNDLQDAA